MTPRYGFTEFGETLLGKKFYIKQKELLDACNLGGYVVGRFNNGGGKTREVLTTIVLGSLAMMRAQVYSTSGSFRQIKDQLNPALHGFKNRFPAYEFLENRIVTRDPNSFYHGFATNEAGRFEGQHGSKEHPLVLIVDEAKTVKNRVFEAVDRCRVGNREWTLTLVVSSAGYAGGEFHALNTSRRDSLTHTPVVQTSHECPHIKPEEIAEDERKWGKDSPLVKSMHYSQFMGFIQGAIVQIAALDELLADPPPVEHGQRKAFCDFAWSEEAAGDESVLALRNGNEITIPLAFREKGLHATAARFVVAFNELASKVGLQAHEVEGDADGRGKEIIKVIRGMGWPILEAHNGGPPRWNTNYNNLAAETWCEGANAIIHRRFRLPVDNDLYAQLINRKVVPNNKGLMAIESKQAMKDPNREGGAVNQSPDKADAVLGCMTPVVMSSRQVIGQADPVSSTKDSIWGERDNQVEPEGQRLPGAWFG